MYLLIYVIFENNYYLFAKWRTFFKKIYVGNEFTDNKTETIPLQFIMNLLYMLNDKIRFRATKIFSLTFK